MMKGDLRMLVLHTVLKHEPVNGYRLRAYLEPLFGTIPSTGTIYPLLNDLLREKKLYATEQGKSKEYQITLMGQAHLVHLIEELKKEINHKKAVLRKLEND